VLTLIKFFIEPGYDVKKPEREFGNAGVDVFVPNYSKTFEQAFLEKNEKEQAELWKKLSSDDYYITIAAHGRVNIPSGIRSRISPNVALEAHNKSGIATRTGLIFGASTVDASYQGIIHISLINTTDRAVTIPLGMKVVQFIPRLIDTSDIEVCEGITMDEFYKDFEFSNRGEGAFGSTGV
jgi:dUTPase